ncbi:hypothetical protein CMV_020011 [Castanea mollissima]|uniref:Uncharacterized protein n=1 Tax=Castanea mollissima TaxID=60419 RepID=A0A8J4VM75_9ROSI|nr:hypothetical protein CMV_020011 [Castanea mollissima]
MNNYNSNKGIGFFSSSPHLFIYQLDPFSDLDLASASVNLHHYCLQNNSCRIDERVTDLLGLLIAFGTNSMPEGVI